MDDRGSATLAVLVYLGLLSAAMAALVGDVGPNLELSRLRADELQAEGLTEAGLEAGAFLLFHRQIGAAEVDGRRLALDGGTIRLGVAPDNARVDLNGSKAPLLAGLFEAVGGQSMSADVFAARVLDRRGGDGPAERGGAGRADDRNRSGALPGRPFRSVEELRHLPGLDAADFERLHPHLTVFNPAGTVDTAAASPAVLAALPGLRPADVRRLLEERGTARDAAAAQRRMLNPVLNNVAEFVAMEPAKVFRLGIDVVTAGGLARRAEAVVTAPAEEGNSFRVLAWTERPDAGRPGRDGAGVHAEARRRPLASGLVRQLASVLERTSRAIRRPSVVLVIEEDGLRRLVRRRGRIRSETAVRWEDLEGKGRRSKSCLCEVRLGAGRVLDRIVDLPEAGRDHLPAILDLQIERMTPWAADRVAYDHLTLDQAPAAGMISVRIVAASKAAVEGVVSRLKATGAHPVSVGTAADPWIGRAQ